MEQFIGTVVTIGFIIASSVGQIMYFKGVFATKIENNSDDIEDLRDEFHSHKNEVRYRDTCDAKHEAIDNRIERLERAANGNLKAM